MNTAMETVAIRRVPILTQHAGYKKHSPGLFGPLPVHGFCLGPELERLDKDVGAWCDFDAPIFSGDIVIVFTVRPDLSIHALGKKIERTRDGRIWIYAWATRAPDSMFAFPLDSEKLRILAIAPIVAELETPRAVPHKPMSDAGGRECFSALSFVGAAAVHEWRTQGFMPRMEIPIDNDPRSVALVRESFKC